MDEKKKELRHIMYMDPCPTRNGKHYVPQTRANENMSYVRVA